MFAGDKGQCAFQLIVVHALTSPPLSKAAAHLRNYQKTNGGLQGKKKKKSARGGEVLLASLRLSFSTSWHVSFSACLKNGESLNGRTEAIGIVCLNLSTWHCDNDALNKTRHPPPLQKKRQWFSNVLSVINRVL